MPAPSPSLSHRISGLPGSPTVALNAKAKALAQTGVKVINLSVGEPDFPTPAAIVERGIAALQSGKTKYGAAGGGPALRQAIIEKLRRDNQLSYEPKEIVAGIGAKEILFHLMLAILNEGDEVLIPAPYWVSYTAHCEAAGARSVVIPMPDRPRDFRLDAQLFEKYASPRTRAVILNSPNNPAGYVSSEAELRELGKFLLDKNWWIISDEIYEYMSFDRPHVSLLQLYPQLRDRFVLVNGLSKAFAMTGWRVGYACGPKSLIGLVENLQSQSSTCLPAFIEDAACYALQQGRSIMDKDIATLKRRRDLVVTEASRIKDIDFMQPQGAFYLLIDLRQRLKRARGLSEPTTMAFSEYLLERGLVAMVPGEAFGAPGYLRMSYAASDEQILAGLKGLQHCLDAIL